MKRLRTFLAITAAGSALVACTSLLGDFSRGTEESTLDGASTDAASHDAADSTSADSSIASDAAKEDASAASDASDGSVALDGGQQCAADGGVTASTPPLDAVPGATAAFGLRRLKSSYAGPLVKIARASDGTTEDVLPVAGDFPVAAVMGWAGGSALTVVTWYDQSGNHYDVTQPSSGARPGLTLDASAKKRTAVVFTFDTNTYLSGSFPWIAGNAPWSSEVTLLGGVAAEAAYEPIFLYGLTQPNESIFVLAEVSSVFDFGYGPYGTNITSSIPTTAPAAFSMRFDGTTAFGNVNGVAFSGNGSSQNVTTTTFVIGGSPTQSDIWLNGSLGDVILYPSALSECQTEVLQSLDRNYFTF